METTERQLFIDVLRCSNSAKARPSLGTVPSCPSIFGYWSLYMWFTVLCTESQCHHSESLCSSHHSVATGHLMQPRELLHPGAQVGSCYGFGTFPAFAPGHQGKGACYKKRSGIGCTSKLMRSRTQNCCTCIYEVSTAHIVRPQQYQDSVLELGVRIHCSHR